MKETRRRGEADGIQKEPRVKRPAGAPYWLPRGPFWNRLSEGVKHAVAEIIEPAYQRLVREARDELERSAGITLVHLMWLEICDQAAMSDSVGSRDKIDAMVKDPEGAIERHLHLVAAKNGTVELLLRLRTVRQVLQREQALAGPRESVPAMGASAWPFRRSPRLPRAGAPLQNASSENSAASRAKRSFDEAGSQAEPCVRRFDLPRFVEDREATALYGSPVSVSEQPLEGSPNRGPEIRPTSELTCGSEDREIGNSTE